MKSVILVDASLVSNYVRTTFYVHEVQVLWESIYLLTTNGNLCIFPR